LTATIGVFACRTKRDLDAEDRVSYQRTDAGKTRGLAVRAKKGWQGKTNIEPRSNDPMTMTLRTLIGTTTLVLGLLPLAALAQQAEEIPDDAVMEESQAAGTQNALNTLLNVLETAPEEALPGLYTAIEAIEAARDANEDDPAISIQEDDQALSNQEALDTLERVREEAPEEAHFGLDTAIQAVSEGGVDGQAVGDTASEGRSSEAGSMGATSSDGHGNAGGMGSDAAGGSAGAAGGGSGGGSGAGGSGGGAGGSGGGAGGSGGGAGGSGGGAGGSGGGSGGRG
jgi:hypothetical protein